MGHHDSDHLGNDHRELLPLPKATTIADLLEDVADVQGVGLDRALLKAIKKKAEALSNKRNLLAHGIWTDDQDAGWVVRETRGAWEEHHPESRGKKRSIEPQSIPMTTDDVRRIVVELDALIADTKKLHQSLASENAQRKSPARERG